jgi:hypothetical protein
VSIEIVALTSLASYISPTLSNTLVEAIKNKLGEKGVQEITIEDISTGEIKEVPVARLDELEKIPAEKLEERLRVREVDLPSAEAHDVSMQAIAAARNKAAELRAERMRQAKVTFNAALALSVIGALIIFIGVGLLLFREASVAGVLAAATGAVTEVVSAVLFRLNSQTNDRLDEIGKDLSAIEAAQIAMTLIAKIEDPAKRDDAIREAARDLRTRS